MDVIEQQSAGGGEILDADSHTGNTLEIRADRRQVNIPPVPLRQTQVGRIIVVINLNTVDFYVQLCRRVGRIAEEPQSQHLNVINCPVLRRRKGTRDL